MTFTDHRDDDPERSIRLNFRYGLPEQLDLLVTWFVGEVLTAEEIETLSSLRLNQFKRAIDCLLANLLHASKLDSRCFVAVSMSPRGFRQDRYNQSNIGYHKFKQIVETLRDAHMPYLEYKAGFQDRNTGIARSTRLRATTHLLTILNRFLDRISEIQSNSSVDILIRRITATDSITAQDTGVQQLNAIRERDSGELIILRNENKKNIDYVDNDLTNSMRNNLLAWNKFCSDNFHIDILLSDSDLRNLLSSELEGESEGSDYNEGHIRFLELSRTSLYRVFNNGSFEDGGRFYGGWWQSVPKQYRPLITINGVPLIELDYSSLQPAMLYALAGLEMPTDAYSVQGINQSYRKLIKKTFFQLINAGPGQTIRAPRSDELPPNWTWPQLQTAVIQKHQPIAQHLRSGVGLKLQRRDSDIAETVMQRMKDRDVLVLPVHDSFLTFVGQESVIRGEMARAYREVMGADIGMTLQPLIEQLFNDEDEENPLTGADVIDNLIARSDFAGYRARLRAFENSRDQAWHRRFGDARGYGL